MQTDADVHHPPLAIGYHALAPGDIANVVTYLEMTARPRARPAPLADVAFSLVPLRGAALSDYRKLYRAVGEEWLWTSRLMLDDAQLCAILDDPNVEAFALTARGLAIGLLELDFRQPRACELAFFGLVAGVIGTGAGRYLMSQAIARAFARPIERFWVHTCTFDSPQALSFYARSGFSPYKQAVEVMRDPRRDGASPRTAAPHVLLLD